MQHIERGNANADQERNVEQQIQRDGRADDFGEIAGGNGDFADDPEENGDRPAEVIAAGLGQIAAGNDSKLERQSLEQDRHQVGQHDDAQKRVIVFGSAGEIGGPVTRDPCNRPQRENRDRQRRAALRKKLAEAGTSRVR